MLECNYKRKATALSDNATDVDTDILDTTAVTRLFIQTDLGRYQFWADRWELEIQDDGQTLHLHGRGSGNYAKERLGEARL